MITLPRAGRGRRSAAQEEAYQAELEAFAAKIKEIDSRSDFKVSSRGWCYILEEHGLDKGDFDTAQELINKCRETGLLPMDICAEDGARSYDHVENLDHDDPEIFLKEMALATRELMESYTPVSFWEDKPFYIQMWTEKIDLKSLFSPVCEEFRIPLANCRGWYDMHMRAAVMRRFKATRLPTKLPIAGIDRSSCFDPNGKRSNSLHPFPDRFRAGMTITFAPEKSTEASDQAHHIA